MPVSAKHPCTTQGCPNLVPRGTGPCPEHAKQREQARGSSNDRGYTSKWRAYRLTFLREHPLCAECETEGRVTAATVVDHIKDHKGDEQLFWDPTNHRSSCKPHHDRRVDAGDFGNPIPRTSP